MPWYIWLLIVFVLGSIVAGLILLRTTKSLPLTDEQLKKVRERKVEMEAKDAKDADQR